MPEPNDPAGAVVPGAGLCNGCRHQRVVQSARGSRFSLCRRAATDPRFPRYPALPVIACAGYEGAAPVGGSAAGGSSSSPSSSTSSSPTSSPSSTSPSSPGESDAPRGQAAG